MKALTWLVLARTHILSLSLHLKAHMAKVAALEGVCTFCGRRLIS